MVSTFSPDMRIELQADGENSGTWGQIENRNYQLFEEGIVGYDSTIDLSSSSATLTLSNGVSSTVRHKVLHIEGTLTANRTVTVPDLANNWIIHNATTGAFTVTITTSGGTGTEVIQGARSLLYCDGVDVFQANQLQGEINPTLGGNLDCNGNDLVNAKRSTVANAGTSITLALTDAGDFVRLTSGSAVTVTVPPNSSVAFPIGTEIDFFGEGAGTVTFAAGSGVTINSVDSALAIDGQFGGATLKKLATDSWALVGRLA